VPRTWNSHSNRAYPEKFVVQLTPKQLVGEVVAAQRGRIGSADQHFLRSELHKVSDLGHLA
jgi:hypothetical protein